MQTQVPVRQQMHASFFAGFWTPATREKHLLEDPRYRPPGLRGVAFHILSSAEAALGAGFDLEHAGETLTEIAKSYAVDVSMVSRAKKFVAALALTTFPTGHRVPSCGDWPAPEIAGRPPSFGGGCSDFTCGLTGAKIGGMMPLPARPTPVAQKHRSSGIISSRPEFFLTVQGQGV